MYMANMSPNTRGPNTTYIIPAAVGLALGLQGSVLGMQGLALGQRGFSDTNMLVYPTRNVCIGSLDQHEAPTRRDSRCSGI